MTTTTQTKISSCKITASRVYRCPECYRKLCKVSAVAEHGDFVVIKHKGMTVLASQAIVSCMECKNRYLVSVENGIERRINLE